MTKRYIPSSLGLFCILTLLATMGGTGCGGPQGNGSGTTSPASPTPALAVVDCSTGTTTDKQIVDAIYAEISGSKILAPQEWQFNITAARPVVTIKGWSPNKTDILNLIKTTAKGCTVNDTDFKEKAADLPSGLRVNAMCMPDHFPCGDICIPVGEVCQINGGKTSPMTSANTNANTNSNSNSNTNTNSHSNSNTGVQSTKKP